MLSLILPTFNEAENLPELIAAVTRAVTVPHEIIVVDDNSLDHTWEVAEHLRMHYPSLQLIQRIGKRGLSSAVVDGFAVATGDVLMVMDSDLQHDPHLIMQLYNVIIAGSDIAVASRYIEGGGVGEWVTGRRILSKAGTWLASALPPVHSSDPMSGFFAIRRSAYEPIAPRLRPTGFKILLEILATLPATSSLTEVPLQFSPRRHGSSKLNLRVEGAFILQILRILLRRIAEWIVRIQFPLFSFVCVLVVFMLAPHVWNIRLLYLDSTVRKHVRQTLGTVSDAQGWLLSDMPVQEVTSGHVRILHVTHRKGPDDVQCFDLSYADSSVIPCP